jgi:hypothetical protein
MLETTLLLGTMPAHLGVPLGDLVAWALVIAFLAAPAPHSGGTQKIIEIGGAKSHRAAACHLSDRTAKIVAPKVAAREFVAVRPAATRLTAADQWQAMSRLVSGGAERVMAVARDQQAIRRELDSLDLTIENLRRELASVMTVAMPVAGRSAELVALPVRRQPRALAA